MFGKTRAGVGFVPLVDSDGVLLTKPGAGSLADAARQGRLFSCANQTPVNTSTTLNTTFTGLGIANPTGSGKLLILHEFGYALDQACAAESVLALAGTTNSGFEQSLTAICARFGYATSVAYLDAAATIVAPVITRIIGSLGQGADSTQFMPPPTIIPLNGSIVIAPGRAIVTDTTAATGATSIQFSYLWEEVDE